MWWGQILKFTILTGVTSATIVKLSFDKRYGESYEESILGKRDSILPLIKRDNGEYQLALKNQQNFYSVNLEIGSPAQKVTVLLDTGSSDLWVTGSDNPYCRSHSKRDNQGMNELENLFSEMEMSAIGEGAFETIILSGLPTGTQTGGGTATRTSTSGSQTINCGEYGTFNRKKSDTFKSNNTGFEITYGDGSFASGEWGMDNLKLGESLNLTGVSIAVANKTNSSVGVLGIGLPGLETTYSSEDAEFSGERHMYANFPMLLKERGITKKNAYSLFLNNPNATHGSVLFGAVDKSKFKGNLYTVPILNLDKSNGAKNPLSLDVTLQGLGMLKGNNQTTFSTTKMPALLDSGSTLAYLPEDLLEMLANSIGANYSDSLGYYILDCPDSDDDTKIVFNFGGFNIETNLTTYALPLPDGHCALGVLPSGQDMAILGDAFLVHAYVVYDLDEYEISMGQANYNPSSEDIELITSSVPQAKKASGYSSTYSTSEDIASGGNIFSSMTNTHSNNSLLSTAGGERKSHNMAGIAIEPNSAPLLATVFFVISMFF